MSEFMKKLIDGEVELAELNAADEDLVKNSLNEILEESGAKVAKWEPKEWRAEYQIIVALSSMGYSNEKVVEISAEKYNYEITKQHVSNILNTEKGKEELAKLTNSVVAKTRKTVEENLELMELLASERLVELLGNDKLNSDSPLAVADRAIKIMEGRGKFRRLFEGTNQAAQNQQQNNFFSLPQDVLARIEEGSKRSQRVEELHGPAKDTRVITERSIGPEESKRSGTDG
jgi:hypothetical protein